MPQLLVTAFNGSPREGGNTSQMIAAVFAELQAEGIATKEIRLGGKQVRGCVACGKCRSEKLGQCVFNDDPMNGWIAEMRQADGIILGSPTYFANVTSEMKAFIDRAGYSSAEALYHKVGAPVVAARRGGAMQTYNALLSFLTYGQMIIPASSYWNVGYGMMPGDVQKDAEALNTMKNLGRNMAWILKKIHA